MSVVAGCSLFDGVLLAADCRVTFESPPANSYYTDNAQKLFLLTPTTAIGFVGDLRIASKLLQSLSTFVKRHRDPISLVSWLRRKFRFEYAKSTAGITKGMPQVVFMVAGALRGRPTIIERKAIAELLFHIARGPVRQSWVPSHLVSLLDIPPEYTHRQIPGTSQGLLCVMRSPYFEIEVCDVLKVVTIGSGETLIEEISDVRGVLFGGEPGDDFKWMRRAISHFMRNKNISSVGGLFPMLRVTGAGTEFIPQDTWRLDHGEFAEHIRLVFEDNRWKQQNLTSGKEIVLLPPWEIETAKNNDKFDDLRTI